MFETERVDGVLQLPRPGARWLATGPGGGYCAADAAYNVSVPEGFDRTDVAAYVRERRAAAGFETDGPAMLTGVDLSHAKVAVLDPVTVVATAGLSNPAVLPVPGESEDRDGPPPGDDPVDGAPGPDPGTVNLVVGTTRALSDGALATVLSTAVEAKTATLISTTGFTGTTSDAAIVGCDPDGPAADFAGSATAVGRSTRICVRDAILASLAARYRERGDSDDRPAGGGGENPWPSSIAEAEYGTRTAGRAAVSDADG